MPVYVLASEDLQLSIYVYYIYIYIGPVSVILRCPISCC
jgi:hypothetical protein